MSRITQFRDLVEAHTGGNPKKALAFGDYLTLMEITYPARRASARAQLTRDMKLGGQIRDLVEKGLVLADQANKQPACFENIDRRDSTLPVVFKNGPIAELRAFPSANVTTLAAEAQASIIKTVSTANVPVRFVDAIAEKTSSLLFEVEREKIRADAAEQREQMQREHLSEMREMNKVLAAQLGRLSTRTETVE